MALTDDAQVGHHELQELCARARGNPLSCWNSLMPDVCSVRSTRTPEALEDLVAARIDRLAPADRTLLRYAAVLGARFSPELFQQTLGEVIGTPPQWDRLADFVMVDQGDLRFSHDLVRRVAYQGLPFAHRRDLHLRVGRALVPNGEPDDARESASSRCTSTGRETTTSPGGTTSWRGSGRRTQYATVEPRRSSPAPSRTRAPAERSVGNDELASAYEALADVALLAGRYDLARDGLRGARRLHRHQPQAMARLCRKEGTLREKLGKHNAALTWYRRGLASLADLPDEPAISMERSRLGVACASTLIWRQQYLRCARWCRRALPDALASGDRATEAHAYYLIDWALSQLGDDEALEYRNLAQPIYEELGDFAGLASVLNNRGVDALEAGRWDEACCILR